MKDAIQAKKLAYKAWLLNKAERFCILGIQQRRSPQPLWQKKSKMKSGENFRDKSDYSYWQVNKGFWQAMRHLRGKRSKNENEWNNSCSNNGPRNAFKVQLHGGKFDNYMWRAY